VIVTHGQVPPMVRWLTERGLQAQAFETEFAGEEGASGDVSESAGEGRASGATEPVGTEGT
jgi:putative mRNA 3-end processing factor